VYACRDLEAWMRCKWTVNSQRAIYERIEEAWEYEPQDFKVFLNFWVGSWIEKWRERVKVLSKKPKIPSSLQEKIARSKELYRGMDHRKELKKMVTEKLMLQGEI
ncbi:MAG: hypothetical protein GTO54_09785, partial [Nitrososphaeria archaeon]|nr:hypothetical protein [Nitrososphaeria archaeon]